MVYHNLILGENFLDDRGNMNFFNAFNMKSVVRFYEIKPSSINIIRAWQGHKKEKKWFYCHTGAFVVNLVQLNDFENPSPDLKPERLVLEATKPVILEISGGYATGFKAVEENSKLQVFSNFSLESSVNDDFRYNLEKWNAHW